MALIILPRRAFNGCVYRSILNSQFYPEVLFQIMYTQNMLENDARIENNL